MPTLRGRGWVDAPLSRVFAFYDDPANLARLTPPPVRVEVRSVEPKPLRAGSVIELVYGVGPLRRRWRIRLTERLVNRRFSDVTLEGPLARFDHSHTFAAGRRGTWVADEITYRAGPDGRLGAVADAALGLLLRAGLVYRYAVQRRLLR